MSGLTHKIVASALAVLFSVVGCAGEALYYLVEADLGQLVQSEGQLLEGFHHHHGDGLWHHHGPRRNSGDSAAAGTSAKLSKSGTRPAVRSQSVEHVRHSCNTLALTSQLKQTSLSTASAVISGELASSCNQIADDAPRYWLQLALGARGPPLLLVA